MSATLPEHSEAIVSYGCEPVVCTEEMAQALSNAAQKLGRQVMVHVMVDTGMGRIGVFPDDAPKFIEHCKAMPALRVRGLMSHFPCADEADKSVSLGGIGKFRRVIEAARLHNIEVCHMANSAAIMDLPEAWFDAVRPGIAVYGLAPSSEITSPQVHALEPVLEWKTRITFLKEAPAGTGLSTDMPSTLNARRLLLRCRSVTATASAATSPINSKCWQVASGVRKSDASPWIRA